MKEVRKAKLVNIAARI